MNPINHAHVVNEINQTNQTNERSHTSRTHAVSQIDQTNQKNQTNHLTLGSPTHAAIWKLQGHGLVLITFLSFFPILFHFEEYLFFTLLTIALAVAWLDGRQIWVRTPIDLPLLLFVGWVLMTIPFAIDPAYSFSEWRKLVAQILVFYWAVLVLRAHPDRSVTRGVLTAVVIGTVILCAYALPDFVARGGMWVDRGVRARAPGSDMNWLGTYLVIAIPLVAAVSATLKSLRQRLTCYVALLGPAVLTLVFSYMRAAWLGLVVQGIAFSLFTGRPRLVIWILGACLTSILVLSGMSELGHPNDIADPGSTILRLTVWNMSIEEVLKHPVVGIGYGNDTFAKRFKDYLRTAPAGELSSPHNTFLMIAMGSGIPALIFVTGVLVSATRYLLSSARNVSDRAAYAIIIGVAIMVVGFAVRNLFDYMFAGSLAYLFWILVAVGISEAIKARAPHQAERHTLNPSPLASYP